MLAQTNFDPMENQNRKMRPIVEKWENLGALNGIAKKQDRSVLAVLLENQLKQCAREKQRTLVSEAVSTTTGGEGWQNIALPLVRKVFSNFTAKELVTVQPMTQPSGKVFFMEMKYANARTGYNGSLYGETSQEYITGGLYGNGNFGYSWKHHDISVTSGSAVSSTLYTVTALTVASSGSWDFDTRFSSDTVVATAIAASKIVKLSVSTSSIPNYQTETVQAYELSSSNVLEVYPAFTKHNVTAGTVEFVARINATTWNNSTMPVVVTYYKKTSVDNRGDYENTTANAPFSIARASLEITGKDVNAVTRKLKMDFSPEAVQDLQAFQAIDVETEMVNSLSNYFEQEISQEIVEMLQVASQTNSSWSARVGVAYNSQNDTFVDEGNAAQYNSMTWNQTLVQKMNLAANTVYQKTMRGKANFAVVSPQVAALLESVPGYQTSGLAENGAITAGVAKIGGFAHLFNVYINPLQTSNKIIMGFKGTDYLDAGAAYCPYIPLISTNLVPDPETFDMSKGLMTRYGKIVLRPEFYATINVHGLETTF